MRTLFRTLVLLLAGILGVLRRLCMSFVGENSMRFFTVILLSGILCLFCFQMAQSAEVKVVDNSVFVETMPMKSSSPTVLSPNFITN